MEMTDAARDWLRIHQYAFAYNKVDMELLHDMARANADEDGRKEVCRNDLEAALIAMRE